MDNENLILESRPISIASYTNYKEAIFLISVLDEPDRYGRIIQEDAGEEYHKTIIGYPIVAKLKKNVFGKPSNFGGHELKVKKTKDGKKKRTFDTIAIGSVIDSWIEEREVEGYDGKPKCILIKAKLWTSRFPEYFKVFDKLWEDGNISSSWELTATEILKKGKNKIYKTFEFIGNCVLGAGKTPAVPGAGVLEYAEFDDYETELANALETDISNIDIADLEIETKKEDEVLANEQVKEILDTPIEDTAEKEKKDAVDSPVEEDNKDKEDKEKTAECKPKKKVKTAEKEETEVASLTDGDLFRKINEQCRKAIDCDWGYISYWFPEEHTVWFKPCNTETVLDYKLFTYEVENDDVTVSEPTDVKLTVSVADVNTEIASKDEKIATLTAELEIKNEAVISAGEKIGRLNVEISELKPYKEKVELAEQKKIETEIAEEKKSLKTNLLKGGLFTEEEITQAEIAELIEARDRSAINSLIAERYIASFDKEESDSKVKDVVSETAIASLEVDDVIEDNPSNFMKAFLSRK